MIEVVALTDAHAPPAGWLLAGRHARQREWVPVLPAVFEDPEPAAELVRRLLPVCEGVAAIDGRDDLIGFLTAFESVPDPASPIARYAPECCSLHPVHGHAVRPAGDPYRIYAALFADLAARALDRGVIDHVVHVPISDPVVEGAWVALGFGRTNVVALRHLRPLEPPPPTDVEVRVALPDELDLVDALIDEEPRFHARSPIFQPYRREETKDAVRAELAERLGCDEHAYLIARRGGDVGVISVGPGLGSPLYVPDDAVYIAATAVLPAERGSGIGAALVDAALARARDHGHRAACLHFSSANARSSSFWTGSGLSP